METVNTMDQGIVKAIKNSNVIRWLLKFNQTLRPEVKGNKPVEDYLSIESDSRQLCWRPKSNLRITCLMQVQMDKNRPEIYSFFNTNTKIPRHSRMNGSRAGVA